MVSRSPGRREQERYEDVYGEPAPEGCDVLCAIVTRDGHVLASLGMVTLKAGARRDPYARVVEAELLVEAQARLEEIEAAKAAAARDAQQKKDALFVARQIAAALCKPDDAVQRGADFISFVDDLLDEAGFITEGRIAFIEAHGFKVEHAGDTYTVTGPTATT